MSRPGRWSTRLGLIRPYSCVPLPEKKQETGTVKMLTQDGKLVEVDTKKLQEIEKLLCVKSKKVSNDQLQNWVYKK